VLSSSFSVVAFLVGFRIWENTLLDRHSHVSRSLRSKTLKSSILVLLILMVLAPVLKTLTASTSSDSVWPLAGILFVLNALLTDYAGLKHPSSSSEPLSSVLSINAALSASVVLASRLPDLSSVFTLILLAVLIFGQLPMLRRRTLNLCPLHKILVTIELAVVTVALAFCVSSLHAILSATALMLVTIMVPKVLMWAQSFKNEIRGPWDVASPVVVSWTEKNCSVFENSGSH